ncbi:MAG TPA: bifunctional DNA-binding transcriptional regulator/O6-methylguanine-DNA methyltransferase Ada [Candidatus Angelobacter sp.]|nr:bifunctional DNA-binding transcriptional regulator/O6-methylguanine-DNA methyltransferase Ada [Candidatus Angelobacter sp.]
MESNYLFKSAEYSPMLTAQRNNAYLQQMQRNPPAIASETEKWRAVVERDETQDGLFVFGVRSTGIYCKPSCPARHPKLEQVVFFSQPDEAENSGFRACKRCHPRDVESSNRAELIQRTCRYIEANLDEKLTLENLSRQIGLSPFHFQRTFKKALGISPRQYVEARRLENVKHSLTNGKTVTNSLYDAGFTSKARLYEKSTQLGVSPGLFRRGGQGLRIHYTIVDSQIGRVLLAATERGACAVCMGASDDAVEAALREDYYAADLHRDDEGMKDWSGALQSYFDGHEFPQDLPLDLQATAFQWRVWKKIQSIPHGQTASYSNIAESLGKPQASRAVARACATNPVAIIIPCHRVIGKDGSLRGYAWGVKRKKTLLALENKAQSELTSA